ncbi:unnamed protein product [Pleuronectes platessa]|uniref:MyoD family inhibitor domain containing n=1 Tax=Pleuronectes platessa TaxID=8262 RepID=A0A9N7TP94_PLEPL|nr:unnamed protein product [Pleuronectes platessa]
MLPGDHLPVDEREKQRNQTKGGTFLNSQQEIPSAPDSVSGGNTTHTDLISTQPLPASPELNLSPRLVADAPDSCVHLLLACLSCQCSVLLLGLLEACSSCLHALCSSCCQACARCCSAIQEAPVEELNCNAHCHSVMFESCCEPTECLEFCLECCEICHRN